MEANKNQININTLYSYIYEQCFNQTRRVWSNYTCGHVFSSIYVAIHNRIHSIALGLYREIGSKTVKETAEQENAK